MTKFLLFLLAVEVGIPVLLFLIRDRMIFFPPDRPTAAEGLQGRTGIEEIRLVHVRRPDGRELTAYDVRPPSRPPSSLETPWIVDGDDLPVVVYFHGNADTIGRAPVFALELAAATGARWFLAEYSGYGGNPGRANEEEVYRDALAVWEHLAGEGAADRVAPERLVLYGQSLGGAVAVRLAADRPVGGLILQSSFASMSSMAWRIYPWMPLVSLLARGHFPNTTYVADLECPILVVHGTDDEVIPFAEGKSLHAAAPPHAEFLAVGGAGHNDLFVVGGRKYLRTIGERVRQWTSTP